MSALAGAGAPTAAARALWAALHAFLWPGLMAMFTSYNTSNPLKDTTRDPPGRKLALFATVVRRVAAQTQQQVFGRRACSTLVTARGLLLLKWQLVGRSGDHFDSARSGGFASLLGCLARLLVAGPACKPGLSQQRPIA